MCVGEQEGRYKLFFLRFYFNQAVKCFILCIGGFFFLLFALFSKALSSLSHAADLSVLSLSLSLSHALSLLHPRSACLLGRLAAREWVCLTSQLRHQTKQAHDKAQGLVPCEEAWAPKMNACQIIKVNRQKFSQTRTWRKKTWIITNAQNFLSFELSDNFKCLLTTTTTTTTRTRPSLIDAKAANWINLIITDQVFVTWTKWIQLEAFLCPKNGPKVIPNNASGLWKLRGRWKHCLLERGWVTVARKSLLDYSWSRFDKFPIVYAAVSAESTHAEELFLWKVKLYLISWRGPSLSFSCRRPHITWREKKLSRDDENFEPRAKPD